MKKRKCFPALLGVLFLVFCTSLLAAENDESPKAADKDTAFSQEDRHDWMKNEYFNAEEDAIAIHARDFNYVFRSESSMRHDRSMKVNPDLYWRPYLSTVYVDENKVQATTHLNICYGHYNAVPTEEEVISLRAAGFEDSGEIC